MQRSTLTLSAQQASLGQGAPSHQSKSGVQFPHPSEKSHVLEGPSSPAVWQQPHFGDGPQGEARSSKGLFKGLQPPPQTVRKADYVVNPHLGWRGGWRGGQGVPTHQGLPPTPRGRDTQHHWDKPQRETSLPRVGVTIGGAQRPTTPQHPQFNISTPNSAPSLTA